MALSVNDLKAHLNVTASTDDTLLTRMLAAAQKHIERLLGFALTNTDEFPTGAPPDVEHAVYLVAAHWYENREASTLGTAAASLPIGVADVIANYRLYTFCASSDGE